MKRIVLHILIFTLPLLAIGQEAGKVLDRKVDISASNQTLESFLKELEKAADFTFAYSPEAVNINRRYSGEFKNKTIREILEKVFENKGVEFNEMKNKVLIRKKKPVIKKRAYRPQARRVPPPDPKEVESTSEKEDEGAETVESVSETAANNKAVTLGDTVSKMEESIQPEVTASDTTVGRGAESTPERATRTVTEVAQVNHQLPLHMAITSNHDFAFSPPELTQARTTATYGIAPVDKRQARIDRRKTPREKPAKEPYKFRIYGASTTGITRVGERTGILMGGRAAWMFTKHLGVGLAGYAFETGREPDAALSNNEYRYSGGYGGFVFEYTMTPNKPIHVSFPIVVGGGGAAYSTKNLTGLDTKIIEDAQAMMIVEPGIELEFNVIKFIKVGFGASYRYTSSVRLLYDGTQTVILSGSGLNGVNGSCTVKFGIF